MSVVKYVYVHKQRYGRIYNKNFTWQSVGLYVSSKLYKVNIHFRTNDNEDLEAGNEKKNGSNAKICPSKIDRT